MNKSLREKPLSELEYIPLEENHKYFSTHDLGCAAALIVCGFELLSLDKEDPKKVKLIFRNKEGIHELITDFWNSNLRVDAQAYFNAIKRLKNQIYSS
jgi:hypothetical protein